MAGYIGTKCMVCSEKFTSDDDVVICPECGTPYHRACYQKEGKCSNTVLHENGGAWKPAYEAGSGEADGEDTVCRFCGYTNPPLTLFCQRCGMPSQSMSKPNDQLYRGVNINDDPDAYNRNANSGIPFDTFLVNFSDPLCGFNPEEDFEGVKMSELGDFVGTNTHYYLPLFKQFKEYGRRFSLNISALFFPELYFSYRKMPLIALAAFILRTLTMIPQYIYLFAGSSGYGVISEFASQFNVMGTAFQGGMTISSIVYYVLTFTFGMLGNRFYYNNAIKKIRKIKTAGDGPALRAAIFRKGGTSALLLTLFICLMALPYAAVYFIQFFR